MVLRTFKYLPLITFLLLLLSCGSRDVYHQFKNTVNDEWHADSVFRFSFDIEDTTQKYNVFVNVRHTHHYPWKNLWLFMQLQNPSTSLVKDTLQATIADDFGKWLGSGSSIFLQTIPYLMEHSFEHKGTHQIQVVHGMRDTTLIGIRNIGIRVEQAK